MKVYWGRRLQPELKTGSDVEVLVNSKQLRHHVYHSPTGFCWGYGGSGPADLARSILWDYLGAEPSASLYHDFKFEFVTKWGAEWTITENEIEKWIRSRPEKDILAK